MQDVVSDIEPVAADDRHTGLVPGRPAVGGGIEVQSALGFLHHAAVQHQLGSDDAGSVGGAVGQAPD